MNIKVKRDNDGWTMFVPEFNENRLLPEDKQISLEIHWLNNGEQKKYTKMVKTRIKGHNLTSNEDSVTRRMFCENVRNIKNLEFDSLPVTTALALFADGPTELITEIQKAMTEYGALDEVDEKN